MATKEQIEAAGKAYAVEMQRIAPLAGGTTHLDCLTAALNAALSLSAPAEYVAVPMEPGDVQLLPFGYAPGDYIIKCSACETRKYNFDKRAILCRECAVRRYKNLVGQIGTPLSPPADRDTLALETTRIIEGLFAKEYPGGDVQRRARIQCAILDVIGRSAPPTDRGMPDLNDLSFVWMKVADDGIATMEPAQRRIRLWNTIRSAMEDAIRALPTQPNADAAVPSVDRTEK